MVAVELGSSLNEGKEMRVSLKESEFAHREEDQLFRLLDWPVRNEPPG